MVHLRKGREGREARRAAAQRRLEKGTTHKRTKAHRLGRCGVPAHEAKAQQS